MRANTSRRQANGSKWWRFEVAMRVERTAAVRPPLALPKNVQLLRP